MTRLLPFLLLSASCFPLVASAEAPHAVLVQETSENNPRNSEGSFVTLKDGSILYIYTRFQGKHDGDNALGHLASCVSKDGGETWDDHDEPLVPKTGKENDMSVSLLRLADGRIALFYLVKNSIRDCRMVMRTSADEGASWSEPVDCMPNEDNYFVVNNDRIIQTKSGRLIAPAAIHVIDGKWSGAADLVCFISDDAGQTWRRGQQTITPTKENGSRWVNQEPGVVELKDGRIMFWARAEGGAQSYAYSSDECETFTPLKPWNFASPLAPASIERIPSTGDLLLVWNDNPGKQRSPLTVAVSRDEGETWQHRQNLEGNPKGWYCYAAIHFVGDDVLVSYWDRVNGKIATKFQKFGLDWLYQTEK